MLRPASAPPLPHDNAGHPFSNVEWWYCYALLTGESGSRYAAMASFFRVGELAVPKGHYALHALIRLDPQRFSARSELDRKLAYQMAGAYLPAYLLIHPRDSHTWGQYKRLLTGSLPEPHRFLADAAVQSRPTRIAYGDSGMTFGDDGSTAFTLRLASPAERVRLRFEPLKPVALIDEDGELNGLRYYSATRNRVEGRLYGADGRSERLRGEGWFDHQWGRSYGLLRGEGWDWFGLQLADGRELLVSRLRKPGAPDDADQPPAVAKLIREDGSVLTSERVGLTPTRHVGSGLTAAVYPLDWRLSLPDYGMELRVSPHLDRQEIPVIGPLQAIWEGVCAATGTERLADGGLRPVAGHGFLELVGYPQEAAADRAPPP